MNISAINFSSPSFKSFSGWDNQSGAQLRRDELYVLNKLEAILNEKQAKHLNISLEIAKPSQQNPNSKRVRIITSPLLKDMVTIRKQPGREHAMPKTYERRSNYVPLNERLIGFAINYTNGQKRYIDYCTRDPYHRDGYVIKKKK